MLKQQTPEKKKKKIFKVWPEVPGKSYGPRPKQKLLFIEDLPDVDTFEKTDTGELINLKRSHYHNLDVVLYIGGARSGKTSGSTARVISYLLKYPGSLAIVGATNYPLLQRTVLKEFGDRFMEKIPWDLAGKKNSPLVRRPTQNDKRCIMSNSSQALFMHLEDPEIIRGISADIILFEEAALLPSADSFQELIRRLSGQHGPVRQLILCTNPESTGGWITETFKLKQLHPSFTGEKEPVAPPCKCHLCQRCLSVKNYISEVPEYVDKACLECGHKKDNECPGNQNYIRIIQTATTDNDTLPSDFYQSAKGLMDEKTARVFLSGSAEDLRSGEVYRGMSHENISKMHQPMSLEKDLIWTLDFNFDPQCSVICQEEETTSGFVIKVLDEIILWNALPEHAAQEFCARPEVVRWKESNRAVIVYGDPAGLFGTGKDLAPSYYKKIYDVLTKNGFDVRVMMKKPDPNSIIKESIKIPVAGRIDAVNAMLTAEIVIASEFDRGNWDEANQERIENTNLQPSGGVSAEILSQADPQAPGSVPGSYGYVERKPMHTEKTHRVLINSKCRHLIRSLWELRWADDGKSIDHTCDRRAFRSTDKSTVHLMTHPSDAFGYYIYKRFPVIKNKRGVKFFQVPGEGIIDMQTGELVPKQSRNERREARREARLQRKKLREERRENERIESQSSMGGWLRETGRWPGSSWPRNYP